MDVRLASGKLVGVLPVLPRNVRQVWVEDRKGKSHKIFVQDFIHADTLDTSYAWVVPSVEIATMIEGFEER
jgi:hypothetical protein